MTATTTRRVSGSAPMSAPAKQVSLTDVIHGGENLPSRVMIPGQPGIGKTSAAAYAPDPLFLLSPGEDGVHTLHDRGLVPAVTSLKINSWENLLSIIEELAVVDHNYKTLVFDTLNGHEKLCRNYECVQHYKGDWSEKGFQGWHRGYTSMVNGPWRELFIGLDKLRWERRMGVLMLAHTCISNYANPAGPDYNRFTPDMNPAAWNFAMSWADIVLFAHFEITTDKEQGSSKAKARGGSSRIMTTEYSAVADAKNRHNLPPEISMGASGEEAWSNFVAALKTSKKEQK